MGRIPAILCLFTVQLATFAVKAAGSPTPAIEVVSAPFTNTAHVFGDSADIVLNADGRWATFSSAGNGLATNDNNGALDAFLRDLVTGETRLISRNASGASADGDSVTDGISADGRFVVFESEGDDLIPGDDNDANDVFLYDRETGAITLVSGSTTGVGQGTSGVGVITRNGQFVLFESYAEDLDPLDQNGGSDLFLFNRESAELKLVTLNSNNTASASAPAITELGSFSASVSEDGRYVAYLSSGTDSTLPEAPVDSDQQLYLRDMVAGTNRWVSQDATHNPGSVVFSPALSTNGLVLAFISSSLAPGPQNGQWLHIYSVDSNVLSEAPAPPGVSASDLSIDEFSLSANGKFVAYTLGGQIYRYEIAAGNTALISAATNGVAGNDPSDNPVISDDGTVTVFVSEATNLAPGGRSDVFELYSYDSRSGRVALLSPNTAGTGGCNHDIVFPVLSADSSKAGFTSYASDLVTQDDKFENDVFAVSTTGNEPVNLVSVPQPNALSTTADWTSQVQADGMSADGRFVAFSSMASDLVPQDDNGSFDVFLRDLTSGATRLVSISPDGVHPLPGPSAFLSMSGDARFVAFATADLAEPGVAGLVYVYDAATGTNAIESILPDASAGPSIEGNLSADGQYLAFRVTGDVSPGIYVRDLAGQKTTYVTNFANLQFAGISPAGHYVLIYPSPTNALLVDWKSGNVSSLPAYLNHARQFTENDQAMLVYMRTAGPLPAQSAPDLYLQSIPDNVATLIATNVLDAALSADGSTVLSWEPITTSSSQLVIHDLKTGLANPVPLGGTEPGFRLQETPLVSRDGRLAVFSTASPVTGGTNSTFHNIFVYDRALTNMVLASHTALGAYGNHGSVHPSISSDGRTIAFQSDASDLVQDDFNLSSDVFVTRIPITDSDNDGMDDGWEITHFGNLKASAQDDPDNDGASNLAEFLSGTDPASATSRFAIQSVVGVANGKVRLTWSAVPGKAYQVQFRSTFTADAWTNLGQPVTALADELSLDTSAGAEGSGFYRVELLQ